LGHSHSLSLSSRGEKLDFRANASLSDNYGVMKGDNRRNVGVNFSIGYHLRDKLTLSYKNSFSYTSNTDSPYGSFSEYARMNPYETIYDEDGALRTYIYFDPYNTSSGWTANPLYNATLSSFSTGRTISYTNSLSGRWNITKELYVNAQANLGFSMGSTEKYVSPEDTQYLNTPSANNRGSYSFSSRNGLNTDGKITINYGRSLDTKGTMFRISLGSNINYSHSRSASAAGTGFLKDILSDLRFANQYPSSGSPSGTDNVATSVGFFINGNFSLWNRFFADASFRTSGSSRFGAANSFAPFWALGAGWNIHNEPFAKDWKWLNTLTLRFSTGYTGSVSFNRYQAKTIYEYKSDNQYYTGIGALPRQMGNPDLKWQRTLNNNLGITAAFLDNRFNLSLDVYSNTTYDGLMPIDLPPSVGTTSMQVNLGVLNNKGFDFSLSAQILRTRNWFWSMTLTGGHVMDQIRNISDAMKNQGIDNPDDPSKPRILFLEGGSQYDIYAMRSAGIDPASGKEIFIKRNGDYTYQYDSSELVAVGNTNPILKGSWMNTLRYKGFSLSVSTTYTFGADYYNSTLQDKVEKIDPHYNVDARAFTDRWKQPGDHTRFLGLNTGTATQYSQRFVEKRNELYISNIQFTYDFSPAGFIAKLGMKKLVVGFGMSDIGYISTVKFERGTGYPYCRNINLIIRPTF